MNIRNNAKIKLKNEASYRKRIFKDITKYEISPCSIIDPDFVEFFSVGAAVVAETKKIRFV